MTERQKRLGRLLSLREHEHARSAGALQVATQELASVERRVQTNADARNTHHDEQMAAISTHRHDVWLLSRAEGELCDVTMRFALQQREQHARHVVQLTQSEMASRSALRQMEQVMKRVREEDIAMQLQKEQHDLDEAARLLRRLRQNSPLS